MPREIAFGGLFFPSLLLVFIISLGVHAGFDWLAERYGWYARVWHPSLLRVAVFVCIFGVLGLLAMHGGWE